MCAPVCMQTLPGRTDITKFQTTEKTILSYLGEISWDGGGGGGDRIVGGKEAYFLNLNTEESKNNLLYSKMSSFSYILH